MFLRVVEIIAEIIAQLQLIMIKFYTVNQIG